MSLATAFCCGSSRERTTFIADPDGRVAQALRKVKPAEHDELLLRALGKASPPPRIGSEPLAAGAPIRGYADLVKGM